MRHKKSKKTKTNLIKNPVIKGLLEKAVSIFVIAVVSWVLGIFTNHLQTAGVIKQLKSDNVDLEWGVDYYSRP